MTKWGRCELEFHQPLCDRHIAAERLFDKLSNFIWSQLTPTPAQAPPLCEHHYPVKPWFLEPCPILPIQTSAPYASTATS